MIPCLYLADNIRRAIGMKKYATEKEKQFGKKDI